MYDQLLLLYHGFRHYSGIANVDRQFTFGLFFMVLGIIIHYFFFLDKNKKGAYSGNAITFLSAGIIAGVAAKTGAPDENHTPSIVFGTLGVLISILQFITFRKKIKQ